MCGIVGYAGNKPVQDVLLNGLKNLEYRGYDSSGIAILDDSINIVKSKGKIANLQEKLQGEKLAGLVGIGHTRWATHGEPSEVNSHPHFSADKKFAIVHNGIIENYMDLKKELQNDGYKFISDTDTEVIVHLFHKHYDGCMIDTLHKILPILKGSYALCVMCDEQKDKFVVAKKDSPLIIGVGEGENFVASDIPAILQYTKKYYFLEDYEMAVIAKDFVKIFDKDKNIVNKEIFNVNWDMSLAEKDGYDFFMMKEIMQQPDCIKKCLSQYIKNNDINFDGFTLSDDVIKNISTLHIIACGSAWHAGLTAKYIIEDMCKIPVNVDIASEFRYRNPILKPTDLCIVISQSGETADSLAALKEAKKNNVKVISVVNVVGSSIARESDQVLYTMAGPEIAVATTKGYSTQLCVLYALALKFAKIRNTISNEKFENLLSSLSSISSVMENYLSESNINLLKDLAKKYHKVDNAFLIGRGIDYCIAMEASLKLKEISYIHSEAYPAGELKHGSIALIEKDTLVFGILTQDDIVEKTISNLKEVKARGAKIVIIAKDDLTLSKDFYDEIIYVPSIDQKFMCSLAIIPTQLFSYYVAINRGCDVDMPRNLAKSVTVE